MAKLGALIPPELRQAFAATVREIKTLYGPDVSKCGAECLRAANDILGPELTERVFHDFLVHRHASTKRRRVELDVECPVCFSQFRSTGNAVPKVNACGHTVCLGCIGALPSPKKCPECRAPIKLPAENLPTNFALFGATVQLP
jgi:hypothetical protein